MRGTELPVSAAAVAKTDSAAASKSWGSGRRFSGRSIWEFPGVTAPDVKADHEDEHKTTSDETERLTSMLRARRTELSRSLRKRDEIVIEEASDALDEVQLMEERELAIRNLDRDSNALRLIHRALLRIVNGTYGVCLHCEEKILPKRMAAPRHGRLSVSSARKRSIAARSKSMKLWSCWLPQPDQWP